ncbi:MAG: hypothetical protein KC645_14895 [Gemmatimonadetes bacterium]|nr:hypothetical protein [Gemmatimonadota bacterium]
MLQAVGRGQFLDRALDAERPSERVRAWVQETVYGVERLRGRLDHALARHLDRPPTAVDADLLTVLRIGAYEGTVLDTPHYAALSQAVELARSVSHEGGARLVNAVLRRLLAQGLDEGSVPSRTEDPAGWLSTWGSHPRWLVERWLARWSFADVQALVEADNGRAPVCLSPADGDLEGLLETLWARGVEATPAGHGSGTVVLPPGVRVGPLLEGLPAFVQDPGAALVVQAVEAGDVAWLGDLCAAPGGKALGLAARGVAVRAADRSAARLRLLGESVDRLGMQIPRFVADARRPPFLAAPALLLDAPCTGTGTLRRHPDGRWRLAPDDLEALARLQAGLLDAAADRVTPGGLLVYATCSLEIEENADQVSRFLSRHPDFRLEAPRTVEPALLDERGCLTVLPQRTGFDGAFAARFRRNP